MKKGKTVFWEIAFDKGEDHADPVFKGIRKRFLRRERGICSGNQRGLEISHTKPCFPCPYGRHSGISDDGVLSETISGGIKP